MFLYPRGKKIAQKVQSSQNHKNTQLKQNANLSVGSVPKKNQVRLNIKMNDEFGCVNQRPKRPPLPSSVSVRQTLDSPFTAECQHALLVVTTAE